MSGLVAHFSGPGSYLPTMYKAQYSVPSTIIKEYKSIKQ